MELEQPALSIVVAQQRERRLNAYRADPSLVRSAFNGEDAQRREYRQRPILELLQNVEDTLSDAGLFGGVFFDLAGDHLLVANHGAPFSAAGFQALCNLNDSAKPAEHRRDVQRRAIGSKGTGFKAVLNWTDRIELFSDNIAALFDRLQAAPIIRAALGDEGCKLLEERGAWPDEQMPLLQVPLDGDRDYSIRDLAAKGWRTVFRLHIAADRVQEVREALNDIDPREWLFLDRLDHLRISIDGQSWLWSLRRTEHQSRPLDTRCYRLNIARDGRAIAEYRVVKRTLPELRPTKEDEIGEAEIGFAWQVDGIEHGASERVANFFATDCLSPFPAIAVHGTFLLKADRSRFAEDDRPYQTGLITALCDLLQDTVIQEMVQGYGPGVLDYLAPQKAVPDSNGSIHRELYEQLMERVKNTKFVSTIGGPLAAPVSLRLWRHGLGDLLVRNMVPVERTDLPQPHWCKEDARKILEAIGARSLAPTDHVTVLEGWQPSGTPAACAAHELLEAAYAELNRWPFDPSRSLHEVKRHFERLAKRLCIWRIKDGSWRTLEGEPPFFEPSKNAPLLPDIFTVDWLDPDFREALKKQKTWDRELSRTLRVGSRDEKALLHTFSAEAMIEQALLPAVYWQPEWWQRHGEAVLIALQSLGCEAGMANDVLDDKLRETLSQRIRVPTQKDGWQPAGQVYAGTAWGNAWAEDFVMKRSGSRFILASPEHLTRSEQLVPVLRYIGVSWWPKWRRHQVGESYDSTWPDEYRKIRDVPGAFMGIEGWTEYWDTAGEPALIASRSEADLQRYKRWPLFSAWAIEGLTEYLSSFVETPELIVAIRELWNRHPKRLCVKVGLRGPLGGGSESFRSDDMEGFVAWQIRNSRVFRLEGSPLFRDGRASLSDLLIGDVRRAEWLKWLPVLDLRGRGAQERKELEAFGIGFGAKEKASEFHFSQWFAWLSALGEADLTEDATSAVRTFLHSLSRQDGQAGDWNGVALPCESGDRRLAFCSPDDLVILDEPRFTPLRPTLVESGEHVLLASEKDGRALARLFGLNERRFSRLAQVSVVPSARCRSAEDRLGLVHLVFPLILAWVEHAADEDASKRMDRNKPLGLRAHKPLKVRIRLNGRELPTDIDLPFHSEGQVLYVKAGDGLWDRLADGLKQRAESDKPFEDGLVRLLQSVELGGSYAGELFLRSKGIADAAWAHWQIYDMQEPIQTQPKGASPEDGEFDRDAVIWPKSEPAVAAAAEIRETILPTPEPDTVPNPDVAVNPGTESYDKALALPITVSERTRDVNGMPIAGGSDSAVPDETIPPPRVPASLAPQRPPALAPAPAVDWSTTSRPSSPPVGPPFDSPVPRIPQFRKRDASTAPSPSRSRGQEARERGREAEDWLYIAIREMLGDGYEIDRNDRSGGGETDLVLRCAGKEVLDIEVKAMSRKDLYWSAEEVRKAKNRAASEIPYVLAVLVQDLESDIADGEGEKGWRVRWIPDPTRQLETLWRDGGVAGRWRWREQSVVSDVIKTKHPWNPPKAPKKKADGITFVVTPTDEDFVAEGLDYVKTLLARS